MVFSKVGGFLLNRKKKLGGFLLTRKKKLGGFLLVKNNKKNNKNSNSRLAPASDRCLYSFVPPHTEQTTKT